MSNPRGGCSPSNSIPRSRHSRACAPSSPDRGYTGLATLTASHGLNLDIKRPPAPTILLPAKPGGKPRKAPRKFTPIKPLYKVENAFARLGTWRRLARCYEETSLGAKTWLDVAAVAYLCARLRVEPV